MMRCKQDERAPAVQSSPWLTCQSRSWPSMQLWRGQGIWFQTRLLGCHLTNNCLNIFIIFMNHPKYSTSCLTCRYIPPIRWLPMVFFGGGRYDSYDQISVSLVGHGGHESPLEAREPKSKETHGRQIEIPCCQSQNTQHLKLHWTRSDVRISK